MDKRARLGRDLNVGDDVDLDFLFAGIDVACERYGLSTGVRGLYETPGQALVRVNALSKDIKSLKKKYAALPVNLSAEFQIMKSRAGIDSSVRVEAFLELLDDAIDLRIEALPQPKAGAGNQQPYRFSLLALAEAFEGNRHKWKLSGAKSTKFTTYCEFFLAEYTDWKGADATRLAQMAVDDLYPGRT